MRLIVDPFAAPTTCRVCGCDDAHGCELPGPIHGVACWWAEPDLCSACSPHVAAGRWDTAVRAYFDAAFVRFTGHRFEHFIQRYHEEKFVPTFTLDAADGHDDERRLLADLYDTSMLALGLPARCDRAGSTATWLQSDELLVDLPSSLEATPE